MTVEARRADPLADICGKLVQLNKHGRDLSPGDRDPQEWADHALCVLAEAAELLGGAVQRLAGEHNAAVTHRAHALATAVRVERDKKFGRQDHRNG